MAEKLQKGWLYTREGDRFAPATLIENVYDRDGSSYLQTLKAHFADYQDLVDLVESMNSSNSDEFADVSKQIAALEAQDNAFTEQLKYFNGAGSDTLFIVDTNSNVIAYIDETGVNSIDFKIPTSDISLKDLSGNVNDLSDVVAELVEKTAYFDGSASEAFFFVDVNKNVVAYVDAFGIHATNFFTQEEDFNTLVSRITALENTTIPDIKSDLDELHQTDSDLNDSIADLYNELSFFDGSAGEAFFIVDKEKNVIAYIDKDGMHSINFSTSTDDFNDIVARIVAMENTEIPNLKGDILDLQKADSDLTDVITNFKNQVGIPNDVTSNYTLYNQVDENTDRIEIIEENTANIHGSQDEAFYIVDEAKNVIAYIDKDGVHSIDFESKSTTLETLYGTVNDLTEALNTLQTALGVFAGVQPPFAEVNALDPNNKYEYLNKDTAYQIIQKNVENAIKALEAIAVLNGDATVPGSIAAQIAAVVDSAPEAFDTLKEIAEWIGEDTEGAVELWGSISDILDIIGNKSDTSDTTLWGAINSNAEDISANAEAIAAINTRTEFIDGTASETFYIIDKSKNVIAYINASGVHAVEFDLADENGSIETFSALRQRLNDDEDIISNHAERISVLESEMNAVENRASSLESRATQLENRATAVENRAESLESRMTQAEKDIEANEKSISDINDNISTNLTPRIGTLETKMVAVGERASSLETRAEAIEERATQLETRADTLEDRMNTAEANIGNNTDSISDINDIISTDLNPRVGTLESEMDTIEGRASALEGRAEGLEDRATALEGRASGLEGRMDTAETDIDNNVKSISDINDNISDNLVPQINDLKSRLSTAEGTLSTAVADYKTTNSIWNKIDGGATLYHTLLSIENALGVNDTDTGSALYRIATLEKKTNDTNDNLTNQVDKLQDAIDANNDLIQQNISDISDINRRTEFIDGTSSEGFYIVDANKNVVAYIDSAGIHAIEFDLANQSGSIETFSALRQRVSDDEDIISNHTERIGTLESEMNSVEDRCTNLESRANTLENRVTEVEDRATALEGQMTTAETNISNNTKSISDLDDTITEGLTPRIGTLETEMDVVEGRATSLEGRTTAAESDIDKLEDRATNVEKQASDLEKRMDTAESNISDNTDAISALQEATGLPLTTPGYDSGIANLYDQVIANKNKLNTATASYTNSDSIWGKIKGDATKYFTLGAIEDVLGTSDSDSSTVLGRVTTSESHIQDIFDIIGTDTSGNATLWGSINDIQSVFGDIFNNDGFYFIDSNKNTIAYFNANGLTVTNVTMMNGAQGLGYRTDKLGAAITVTDVVLNTIE